MTRIEQRKMIIPHDAIKLFSPLSFTSRFHGDIDLRSDEIMMAVGDDK